MKITMKKSFAVIMALVMCFSMLWGLSFTASAATQEIVFELGANGSASHTDGSSSKTTYSETNGDYTLSLTSGANMYPSSRDAKGNSAIKLGTSSKVGSFSISVPADVTSVIFKVAQYKANTTKIKVNNTSYTITTASNNGAYTDITVDTTTTKTITFTTVSGGVRCMINSITYVVTTPDEGDEGFEITATSNNEDYGTVEVSNGTIVATPEVGYIVDGYTITSGSANVTQNGNVFTVEATSNVSITINFAPRSNTITFVQNGTTADTQTIVTGNTLILPEHIGAVPSNMVFKGWYVQGTTTVLEAGTEYSPTTDVVFNAKYDFDLGDAQTTTATLTFNSTNKRTEYSTTTQVWSENGITFTNLKASSTSNVADYASPVRLYKSSSVSVSFPNMYKIEFVANTAAYATDLKNSIGDAATVNNKTVTVELLGFVDEFTIASLGAQVRLDSITVYAKAQATPTGTITGAQVSIGSDLSVDFFAEIENLGDNEPQMQITFGDETFDAQYLGDENGEHAFSFTNIAPQRMTDVIKAELIVDGEVIATKDDYSIQKNAENILSDNPSDELKRFVTDMLYYGAAAQMYTGYNTNNLATSGTVADLLADESELLPEGYGAVLSASEGTAKFKSASVFFDVSNRLIIKVNNPENADTKVFIRYDDDSVEEIFYSETLGGYLTCGIAISEFGVEYQFELYEDDSLVQTLTYSVNAYTVSKQNSTNANMAKLAIALYRLGQSAEQL